MRSKVILAGAAILSIASAHTNAQILSSKRGFADTGANYGNLQATNAGWYYTWGTGTGSPGNFDANHYPMIWSGTPSQSTLNNLVSRNPTYVLGFNEPERTDQANMTVAQAISSWTPISNAFTGTSTKLVSPSVADTGGTTGGQQWLSSFVSQARAANLKLDAIAFHWYGVSTPTDPAGAASSFLGRVQSYWNTYQLPIFITEFAIHDWGGAYTDAEIAEANRQFLGIVIPALESRSYVAGYAWYHWFGDSKLYDNNLTPTTLGYNYIGAVGPGATSNISGQSFGEHVAPLTGGTVSVTGAAPTLKFIHALSGESTLAGTTDWTLAGFGNWVKIQPGARLTKAGTNTFTFNSGTVTNNGVLEVAQGRLNLGSNVTGNGTVRVKGGTLALSGLATLRFTPLIDVRAGGTLDSSGLTNASLSITDGRQLVNNGTVIGNVLVNATATASGAGTFNGNLSTLSSGNLRVGTDRLGVAKRSKIDDLETYATGDVITTAASNWTAHMGTAAADIVDVNGTRALSFGATSGFAGVSRPLPATTTLDDSATGTFFFRINAAADNLNHNVGVGDQAQTGMVDFADFEAQLRLKQGTTAGTFAIDARSGSAFTSTLASGLSLNTWYNVWMVVNNATDRFDVYLNTGDAAATAANKLNGSALLFRNGTNQDLDTFLAMAGAVPVGNAVRLDGISFQTGIDLTNPMAGFDPGYAWSHQTMSVTGNYTHNSGANLTMDLGTSAGAMVSDTLHVDGAIELAGTLKLEKADGFAATLGQSSTLMSGATITGTFQSITGVALDSDTALAVTYAATDVLVTVATPGDANLDGNVDFDDLLALAQHYESGTLEQWATGDFNGTGTTTFDDLLSLAQHYGTAALVTDSLAGDWALARSFVPEPTSAMIAACGFAVMGRRRVK